VLIFLAIFLIGKKFEVSAGHSAIVVIGAALIALPYVANFEWTEGGIKFTTKDQGFKLADQLTQANAQVAAMHDDLARLAEALKASTERIAALEAKTNGGTGSSGSKPFNPAFFDSLIHNNEAAKSSTNLRIQQLDDLKNTLQLAK
jgi:hypothetical protein